MGPGEAPTSQDIDTNWSGVLSAPAADETPDDTDEDTTMAEAAPEIPQTHRDAGERPQSGGVMRVDEVEHRPLKIEIARGATHSAHFRLTDGDVEIEITGKPARVLAVAAALNQAFDQ